MRESKIRKFSKGAALYTWGGIQFGFTCWQCLLPAGSEADFGPKVLVNGVTVQVGSGTLQFTLAGLPAEQKASA